MFERRSILLFIGMVILLICTLLSGIGALTSDMGDALTSQGLEAGSEDYELALSITKGILFFALTSMILATVLYASAFVFRKPGLALIGAIICTVSLIASPIFFISAAVCGYMGFSKQKKINQDYELLNNEYDNDPVML